MSKQSIIVIVAAVAVFVLILVFVSVRGPSGTSGLLSGGEEAGTGGAQTREGLARNVVIVVPDVKTENIEKGVEVPEGVAIPETVAPANSINDSKFRSFSVAAKGGKFNPETIIVNQGDTVRIDVAAVDDDYDYTEEWYGIRLALAKGQSKFKQFDATAPGKFTIYCKSCGGPDKGPVGYLVVAPKQ